MFYPYVRKLFVLLLFLGSSYVLRAQTISGTVYRDFNGNGTRQTSGVTIEPGTGGVLVNAYDASNSLVASAVSNPDGSYSMPYTVPVRLEFVIPSVGSGNYCSGAPLDFTGFGGDGNNIRFITASTSGIDYAIHYPFDYVSNTNPPFYFPQYSNGNPLGGGTTGTATGFKGHLYNHTGTTAATQTLALSQIGTTWGVAYSKQAKVLFSAALVKRHAGLGPLGSGGIYKLTPTATSFTTSQFYDLDANGHNSRAGAGAPAFGPGSSYNLSGVNLATYLGGTDPLSNAPFGLGVIGSNTDRNLPANFATDNNDPAAMGQVGRVGLGDIDISDDGRYLFVVNLYQRVIHRLELDDAYNPTSVISVTTFSIPAQPVTNGVLRPFGLGFHRGDIYLGAVASGENGGVNNVGGVTDLYGFVFRLKDATTGSAAFESTPLINLPLNYAKGPSVLNDANAKKWYPWNNSTSALLNVSGESTLPTPILSDIDFSDNGDMILDFMDRSGHQFGYQNYLNLSGTTALFTYDIGGDILIAGKDCGGNGFTIENNGSFTSADGTSYTSGAANGQGPGNSEFFVGEFYPTWHSETSMGSCAVLKGTRQVLTTLMDPINDFSSGTGKLSTVNGTRSGELQAIRTANDFGKANGLGDIEVAGDVAPLEIGNRVWNDANANGVQDPTEVGIANVSIELFCDADNNQIPDGAAIATTNTDGNGYFYFNKSNVTDGNCTEPGNQAGPQPGLNYLVSIGSSDWTGGSGTGDLNALFLAPSNSASNGIVDASDNDATLVSGVPTISVLTSSKWGDNNHTFDFGFTPAPPCTVTASVVAGTQSICSGGDPVAFTETTAATGSGTLTYQWQSSTTDCASGFNNIPTATGTTYDPPAGLTVTTYYHVVVTNTDGADVCTDISNCITVTVNPNPSADAGPDKSLDCATTSTTIGTAAVGGNSYSWSPASGLNATNIAEPTANPSTTTTYTVTVTTGFGCTATDDVMVSVNTTPPTADAGQDKSLDCSTTSTTIGTAAIGGNTYSWSPSTGLNATNVAEPTANPSSTTTYTVTVTGSNGCTASDMVTVTVNTTPPTADAGQDKSLDCSTTSTTIGTAAIGGNTYSWSPSTGLSATNVAQPTANPSSTSTYTVTVTGSNGCTASDMVTVTVTTAPPTADAGQDKSLDCATTSTTIGTAAIGGNTYSWSPSTGLNATNVAEPTANPSSTTTYTVIVTGSNGCTASDMVTVTVNTTPPTADAGQDKSLDCSTTSTTIGTAAIGGNTYSWSPSTGLNATNVAEPTANPSSTTTYTVTVTGSNGCTASDMVTVTVNTTPPTADAGQDKSLDCSTTSTTIGTAAIGGNTYSWSPSTGLSATNVAQPTANPSSTTTYTVTVTGSNGCTASDMVTVTVTTAPPTADAGQDKSLDCSTTSTTIGTAAIGGNTYSWSPSTGLNVTNVAEPTANPSSTTTYTVIVTGSNGCTASDMVTVTVNTTPPTADAGQDKSLDCSTTSTTIGTAAIGGNTYSWSPSTGLNATNVAEPTANPSSTTTYTVTVTGSNGCTASDMVTVTVNTTPPTADAGQDKSLDCSTTSTTIGTAGIGGNTYSWSPSSGLNATNVAEPTANPSSTTTYTVTVTASNGCTASDMVTVTVNTTPPTVDAGSDKTLDCTTTSTTIGTAAISGNTYSWSPSSGLNATNVAEPTANPSSTTTYTVTVTGSNGCTASDMVTVTVDVTPPTADAGQDETLTCSVTSVFIGSPAISGNTYSWSPSTGLTNANVAQPTAYPTATTSFTVTVTGSNGCTASDMVTVTVDVTPPTVDAGPDKSLDCTTTTTTIGTAAISGNTYSWNPASGLSATNVAEPTANPSTTTTYTVTVTGSNGCTESDVVTITVNTTTPTADAGQDKTIDCAISSVMIGTAAIAGNTYNWDPGTGLNDATLAQPTASPSSTTQYTVTVTASNGCTATDVMTVTVNGNLGSVGNYVWIDLNANGMNDEPATAGVNGVTVELWKETSSGSGTYALLNTTITANNAGDPGYYSFSICDAANYKIKFPLNVGAEKLTSQTATPATDANSDANVTDGFSPVFMIDPNGSGTTKDNPTIDAGYYTTACLGNYVWNDLDKNGIQDANEVGVAGITVTLYNSSDVVISTTVTDAYGKYHFCELMPGDYKVGFTLPQDYNFSVTDSGTDDNVDNDASGTTGLTGFYTLKSGDDNLTVDAGIFFEAETTASVGNYVWYDTNQDGIQDPMEVGISGVTVVLYDNTGNPVAATITDGNGFYLFTDVPPGNYTVGFTPPTGLGFSPNNGGVGSPSNSDANPLTGITTSFTVNPGDQITYVDAGLYQLPNNIGSLGDRVWYDVNEDGNQDADEVGVEGVTVTLYGGDGITVLNTTTTNVYGNYIFNNLVEADYVVGFSNLPVDYVLTVNTGTDSTTNSDADPLSGKTNVIHLGSGQHNMTYDAGIYTTDVDNTNSIGNYVWNDINKDGIQDATENGVPGITVSLYDNTNLILKTTSTDENGFYLFPDLPNGIYYVGFSNLPVSYQLTSPNQGADDALDSDADQTTLLTATTTLTGNTNDMTLDAGIFANNDRIGKGSLGDKVWYDLNNDGLQDANEGGVPGVLATLYEQDGTTVLKTTTTDALGNYIFTGLDADSYVVGFTNLPSGFTITTQNSDNQGVNGELNSDVITATQKTPVVALGQGENKLSVDMGIVPPVGSAGLGNYVWIDLNTNGLQDVNEPGVTGVTVTLYNSSNNPVAVTTTNSDGQYQFVGLTPGTYAVGFSNLPDGYELTTQNADATGINGAANSDADVLTGITASVTLAAGDFNPNLDAGIFSTLVASLGDYVWLDMNGNGVQDPSEPGVGGILVTLYDNTGTPLTSMITNPKGGYLFSNLNPGTYYVGFTNIPSGMIFSAQETNPSDATGSNANPLTGTTPTVVLAAGSHNPTIDAGLMLPNTAGLGDYVWHDVDKNGQQNAGEPAIAGVLVTLYDGTGTTTLATAITDGSGAYSFTNLSAGDYQVGFAAPTLFTPDGARVPIPTQLNNGTDASDNDADPISGRTTSYTLAVGEFNPTIDAGFIYQFATPITLSSFNVNSNECSAFLSWTTSMEKNADYFAILRKDETTGYTEIGRVKAAGNSNLTKQYSFNDKALANGTYWYQLKLVDIDGNFSNSSEEQIQVNCGGAGSISVYPNPVEDVLHIQIIAESVESTELSLMNTIGQVVIKQQGELEIGVNELNIPMQRLAAGTYYLKVTNGGIPYTIKVTKQ